MKLLEQELEEANSKARLPVAVASFPQERGWVTFHVIFGGPRMSVLPENWAAM